MFPPPAAVEDTARELGLHIAEARKRRRWTQAELARRAGITRQTLMKIERGHPGTALSAYVSVLWAMGLHRALGEVGSLPQDAEGQTLQRSHLAARVRHARSADDDF